MTYQRLPYEDAATTAEMAGDCVAVARALGRPEDKGDVHAATSHRRPGTDEVVVPDGLAARAREMQLHLG